MTTAAADGQGVGTQTPEQIAAAAAATDKAAAEKAVADKATADTAAADKAVADKAAADKATADAAAKAGSSKAPDTYALTIPDGGRLDAQDLATIETIARREGWTNEEAQARVAQHAAAIEAQSAAFLATTNADAVYGGERLPETLKHAGAALDHFRPKGTPRGDAFRALLDKSGYGNHVEVVSLLADLGKSMAEDGNAGGQGGGGEPKKGLAERMYPNYPKPS